MGLCAGIGLRGGRKQGRRSGVSEIRSAIGLSKENRHPKEKKKNRERETKREPLCGSASRQRVAHDNGPFLFVADASFMGRPAGIRKFQNVQSEL